MSRRAVKEVVMAKRSVRYPFKPARTLSPFALTGYGQASDVEKSRSAGFHQHLLKPIDMGGVLQALIAAALNALHSLYGCDLRSEILRLRAAQYLFVSQN
jgi:hypothetical protein